MPFDFANCSSSLCGTEKLLLEKISNAEMCIGVKVKSPTNAEWLISSLFCVISIFISSLLISCDFMELFSSSK